MSTRTVRTNEVPARRRMDVGTLILVQRDTMLSREGAVTEALYPDDAAGRR